MAAPGIVAAPATVPSTGIFSLTSSEIKVRAPSAEVVTNDGKN